MVSGAGQDDDEGRAKEIEGFAEEPQADEAKRQREIAYHTRELPALRLLGMVLLSGVLLVLEEATSGVMSRTALAWFIAGSLGYSGVSWWLLRRHYLGGGRRDLGLVFLAADIFWFALAVWLSGGDRSWLVFLPLVRVADQTNTTLRRVLFMLHLAAASYLLVLLAQQYLEHRPPHWPRELGKLAGIYVAGLYLASTTRTAERLRARTRGAVRLARKLVERLRQESASLEKARAAAEQSARVKGEFLANMGHELRTPLGGIIGLTDLALDGELSADQRECLTGVKRSGENLLRMVNDVLELSRIQSEEVVLRKKSVDPAALVRTISRDLAPRAAERGLALDVSLASDLPPAVVCDGARVDQVMRRLADNALKFTDRGRVTLEAAVERVGGAVAALKLGVLDTGIGIAAEQQPHLFEAFRQVDGSSTRRHEGCGMGLAIVRRLVQAMGGQIKLESALGAGAAFHVTVPTTTPEEGATAVKPAAIHQQNQESERT